MRIEMSGTLGLARHGTGALEPGVLLEGQVTLGDTRKLELRGGPAAAWEEL